MEGISDFARSFKANRSVEAQSVSGAVNGAAVDCQGYDEAVVMLDCGTITATGTLDVKVQESDASGSGFADITSAAFTQCTPSNDQAIYVMRIRMVGRKRYLRAVATQATAAALASVTILLGQPRTLPAQTPDVTI